MKRTRMILCLLSVVLLVGTQAAAQSDNDIRETAFYFGAGYTYTPSKLNGVTGIVGGIINNNDFQASYTYGLDSTPKLYWYDANGDVESSLTYKRNSIGMKYGYQIRLTQGLAITPQLGMSYEQLTAKQESGNKDFGKGADAWCATAGLKIFYSPVAHCAVFVSPEYKIPVAKDVYYEDIMKKTDIAEGGVVLHAGLLFFF